MISSRISVKMSFRYGQTELLVLPVFPIFSPPQPTCPRPEKEKQHFKDNTTQLPGSHALPEWDVMEKQQNWKHFAFHMSYVNSKWCEFSHL